MTREFKTQVEGQEIRIEEYLFTGAFGDDSIKYQAFLDDAAISEIEESMQEVIKQAIENI